MNSKHDHGKLKEREPAFHGQNAKRLNRTVGEQTYRETDVAVSLERTPTRDTCWPTSLTVITKLGVSSRKWNSSRVGRELRGNKVEKQAKKQRL